MIVEIFDGDVGVVLMENQTKNQEQNNMAFKIVERIKSNSKF